jgi:1-acyl-sn-glycerol-3-phosphate acyltransferase
VQEMKRPNSRRNRVWVANWLTRPWLKLVIGLRYKVTVHGAHHVPRRGAAILAITHPSQLDPGLIAVHSPNRNIAFMAKHDLFERPVLGSFMRWHGNIPVDRRQGDDNAEAQRAGVVEHGINVVRYGGVLGVFHQGGCYHKVDGKLYARSPKNGAVKVAQATQVPVTPVHITDPVRTPARRTGLIPWKRIPVDIAYGKPVHAGEPGNLPVERVAQLVDGRIRGLGYVPPPEPKKVAA